MSGDEYGISDGLGRAQDTSEVDGRCHGKDAPLFASVEA